MKVHEQMHEKGKQLDAIVIPVGGAGLFAGIAIAIKELSPKTEVIVSDFVCKWA